ncbi:MAG: phospholipase D-like domain-containing protein [Thermoanaerobaculia bacterium]
MPLSAMPDPSVLRRWLETLQGRDPKLYEELSAKLVARESAVTNESTDGGGSGVDVVLETIVRSGRPALLVQNNKITPKDDETEDAAKLMIQRLLDAKTLIEPLIPLVGRIDMGNHASGLTYAGTGWLIAKDKVVTNRHVAELISRADGAQFTFRPGRFGDPLEVSIDFRHEYTVNATDSAPVLRVLYIEGDSRDADFALLEIGRRTDGSFKDFIDIAESDATPDSDIAVVGYPARAPAHIIADQAWMDRIYNSTYDIKRVAPGLMGKPNQGWNTHDATTLGGNSGSVVLDLKTGKAVGLHFAGLYMIENYCVPASRLQRYLKETPWTHLGAIETPRRDAPSANVVSQSTAQATANASGEITVTVPVTIRVSLGNATVDTAAAKPAETSEDTSPLPPPPTKTVEAAAALDREIRGNGVLKVRHGYLIAGQGLSDKPCLVVAADPSRMDEVRARVPKEFGGFPVDVRPASLRDQAEGTELAQEAGFNIAYDDDNRTGKDFSFDFVEEKMDAIVHVGPERSWVVLQEFLRGTKKKLVSSIYEFHAKHIADALETELDEGASLKIVMAPQTRDASHGNVAPGDFARKPRFEKWTNDFGDNFEGIFVPVGNGGLVAKAYHIKVTVRDDRTVWLSSGNWKRASQPNIAKKDLDNPKETGKAGNREWHVVIDNKTLASRYQNHIAADYERCSELGGTLEAVQEEVMVDVPMTVLEAVELEAAPKQVFEPLRLNRTIKVKPLLTPDQKGAVYSKAVLELIKSAKKQLLFQNQYITVDEHSSGFFGQLVDALVDRSRKIDDVRIILRSGGDGFLDNMAELKRRGMDVNRCVKRISATHTKGIIVDGKRVLIGSHNWSSLGVTLNRDASLIFHDEDIAQYFAKVFEEDWTRSASIETESVSPGGAARIAVGPEPPPGFVRMPLSSYLEG